MKKAYIELTEKAFESTLGSGGFSEGSGGYMVAIEQYEHIIYKDDFTEGKLYDYIEQIKDTDDSFTLGTWFNKVDNNIYLDVSIGVDTLEQAKKIAKENKQKAIYNVINDDEIYL